MQVPPKAIAGPVPFPEIVMKRIPYPLRATKLSLDFKPFGFWLKPCFVHRKRLTESARENGETIWFARWAWFQIRYSRWL